MALSPLPHGAPDAGEEARCVRVCASVAVLARVGARVVVRARFDANARRVCSLLLLLLFLLLPLSLADSVTARACSSPRARRHWRLLRLCVPPRRRHPPSRFQRLIRSLVLPSAAAHHAGPPGRGDLQNALSRARPGGRAGRGRGRSRGGGRCAVRQRVRARQRCRTENECSPTPFARQLLLRGPVATNARAPSALRAACSAGVSASEARNLLSCNLSKYDISAAVTRSAADK